MVDVVAVVDVLAVVAVIPELEAPLELPALELGVSPLELEELLVPPPELMLLAWPTGAIEMGGLRSRSRYARDGIEEQRNVR